MQDERPAISETVPSATSFIQKSIQKLGEPRVLGWLAVAFVLITWEAVVAARVSIRSICRALARF